MYKEIITILIVVIVIVSLDIITNNYTESSVIEISSELNILREDILNKENEKSKEKMNVVKEKWEKRYNIMAYYIEHDELEKVETHLTMIKADIDVEEYNHCIEDLDTTIYILEHIEEKEEFNIQSIF